ncbi:MAG TPA: MarR family transcriptional regulator [Firmicutes bacterium]|jgi:DNA-binding MarR family transcriptional regulator|nr:MarR family transcriptional regulator [Bacillota bacterium]
MDQEILTQFIEKLHQLEKGLSCCFKIETQCCGVSMAQCQSLLEIARKEQISLVEVAAGLGLDTSTLSRMVNNLVNLGLVNRVLNPNDRRYISLSLTEQGKRLCNSLETSISNYILKILGAIPAEKHAQVAESIALLASAVKQCGEPCNCEPGDPANSSLK